MSSSLPPEVVCTGCGRRVRCVRVSDSTVYKPFAWIYPDKAKPLEGLCGGCQTDLDGFAVSTDVFVDCITIEHDAREGQP